MINKEFCGWVWNIEESDVDFYESYFLLFRSSSSIF